MKHFSPRELSLLIRITAAEMIATARSSHIGGVFSCSDILAILYGKILRRNPEGFYDSFILSKGHCCAGVYAALHLTGYLDINSLNTFAQNDSRLMAHISHHVDHVDFSTGSLGHGLAFGVGKSFAFLRNNSDQNVFVLLSDGELAEGSNWEAIQFAGFHRLHNLTAIIDYNKLQSLTSTYDTLDLEPLVNKFEAFGWDTYRLDGHSLGQLFACLSTQRSSKPKALICDTIKGYPISFMKNKVEWHYKPPSPEQLALIIDELKEFYQ